MVLVCFYYLFSVIVLIQQHAIIVATSATTTIADNAEVVSSSTSITSKNNEVEPWLPASDDHTPRIQDLHREYSNIFRHGNRNAASHRWSSFLFDRSNQMTLDRFQFFMSGYCAVSGSPVRPSDYTRYRLTLPLVGSSNNEEVSGYMYYCCWPCVCDTQDFIRIDTKTITTIDGIEQKLYFAVIGNPCDHPDVLTKPFVQPASYGARTTTLQETAPEVRCDDNGHLKGATLSDHGYVIISMFFDATVLDRTTVNKGNEKDDKEDEEEELTTSGNAVTLSQPSSSYDSFLSFWDGTPTPGRLSSSSKDTTLFNDEREWAPRCTDRAGNGYQSGMGEIFRRVSSISPIKISNYNKELAATTTGEASSQKNGRNESCDEEEDTNKGKDNNFTTMNDPKTVQMK